MKLPYFLLRPIRNRALMRGISRAPDFTIPGERGDYLQRWFLTPWSKYDRETPARNFLERLARKLPNIYLHKFLESDIDAALHDHPWASVSILLLGSYVEHTIAAGGVRHARTFNMGDLIFRGARYTHRIEIDPMRPCWTIFITGPSVRAWGFHCPSGWRSWQAFQKASGEYGEVGRGCE